MKQAWLEIDGIAFLVVLVEHLFRQPLGIGGEAIAQRACGCGRRTDAAHQRERAPEREAAAILLGPRAFDHSQTIIEHGIVEVAMRLAQRIGLFLGLVARKDALLAPVDPSDVDAPALYEMAGEPFARLARFGYPLSRRRSRLWV